MACLRVLILLGCCVLSGCATARTAAQNPFFVAADNEEAVWERTVDVVHDYFEIARENRLDGVIETRPKVGASLLEPHHKDSVGFESRLESTLQSIRRRALVNVNRTQGGFLVGVEVVKEQEDLPGVAATTAGGATFAQTGPLRRDLNLVVGQSAPSGWIVLGRDELLEQEMTRALHRRFHR